MSRNEAGKRGGKATVRRHGREHMRRIGKRGFEVTVARHWGGDRRAYRDFLHARGWHAQVDRAFDQLCAERFAAGETVVCVEVPVIPEEDDWPF
jgi:general stress protein YciG